MTLLRHSIPSNDGWMVLLSQSGALGHIFSNELVIANEVKQSLDCTRWLHNFIPCIDRYVSVIANEVEAIS
ncbi:hypothetical protein ACFLSQ_04630 [Bacteroidota bacterium]